jgi:hypothetical protein
LKGGRKMAKAANFTIDNKKQEVRAVVAALSERELKEVKNYLALGYTLVPVERPKKTAEQKAQEAIAAAVNPYGRTMIEAFLKRPENAEYYAIYDRRYNEQAGTNRKGKDDEPVWKKDGTPKLKGFANCIGWFTDIFEYDKEKKTYKKKKAEVKEEAAEAAEA